VAIANFKKVAACSVRYFLPGTIWFPVTTRYYPQSPSRLRTAADSVPRNSAKVRACVRAGTLPGAASFLAEKFAGLLVDEMKPGTGEADDGRIGIGLVRRGLRKPMLHVGAQLRAFEKDMSAHSSE
jgi:hypothetical protein